MPVESDTFEAFCISSLVQYYQMGTKWALVIFVSILYQIYLSFARAMCGPRKLSPKVTSCLKKTIDETETNDNL